MRLSFPFGIWNTRSESGMKSSEFGNFCNQLATKNALATRLQPRATIDFMRLCGRSDRGLAIRQGLFFIAFREKW
jgi:hypothetical protein